MSIEYDPNRSKVSADKLSQFIKSPILADLCSVPGISTITAKDFEKAGISTTHQLIGLYLSLKDKDTGPVELADKFYFWLQREVPSLTGYRAGVVQCICEKCDILFPGIYDRQAYNYEE